MSTKRSKVFWFPENVQQLYMGAYQSVRFPPAVFNTKSEENLSSPLMCTICQEEIIGGDADELNVPLAFRRRCRMNPLLNKVCEGPGCTCTTPNLCLECGLKHLLENGIMEGKSSVYCPR